ncbi:T9SS type A sorting domain-containing protein, partial [Candidatus Dojkabacteria bacterium]|nr:T9SS type A sorting domain-containing protein [Candidatus Dojkabacteria bacterium]
FEYNLKGSWISNCIYSDPAYGGYPYNVKLAKRPDSKVVALDNYYDVTFDGIYYSFHTYILPDRNNGYVIKNNNKTYTTELQFIKDITFAFIEDYSKLTLAVQNSAVKWQRSYPKTTLNSICRLTDTSFAVAGSKEGYCWFGFFDLGGNITQEYKLDQRYGEFAKVSLCKDGSLLLTGSVYKNKDENSLYLFKTTKVVVLDETPVISKNSLFEVNALYKTDGNIKFKINLTEPGNVGIEVYDILGRLTGKTSGWVNSASEFSMNCGNYSGLLIYRVIAGNNVKTGKILAMP